MTLSAKSPPFEETTSAQPIRVSELMLKRPINLRRSSNCITIPGKPVSPDQIDRNSSVSSQSLLRSEAKRKETVQSLNRTSDKERRSYIMTDQGQGCRCQTMHPSIQVRPNLTFTLPRLHLPHFSSWHHQTKIASKRRES